MIPSTLIVGLDDAPPIPMQIGTPEEGNFRGYEVDLLEEVARRLGVRLRYRRAYWSVIVDELEAGDIDIICSAATITEERRRQADCQQIALAQPQPERRRQTDCQQIALA